MISQVQKFYLASFLKNQTYFVPIMVIFFQDLGLSYTQIFWVLTLGSLLSFILEIPTGIFADQYGKRKSIILSKLLIAISFVSFGFSTGFWTLLLSNLLLELGKSFRSGTETAFVFDYLEANPKAPRYTRVKAQQKFYARLSESIATSFGGLIAVRYSFNLVFFLAAIPAFINFVQTLTWVQVKEVSKQERTSSKLFLSDALKTIWRRKALLIVMINVLLYSTAFVAVGTFIQPYMVDAGLPVESFGFIYSGFLLIVAFLTRYSSNLEEKYGDRIVMNTLTAISVIPLIILGLGYSNFIGVGLFFFVLLVQNFRSPISNSLFHSQVDSKNRATMGSILALFQNGGNLLFLPLIGFVADSYSIYTAIFVLAIIVFFAATLFSIRPNELVKQTKM